MSNGVIEAAAEVIEPSGELEVTYTPAVFADNLAALDAYVQRQIEPYVGARIDPNDGEQVKEARKCMANLNKLKEPIEAERKRIKRAYEAPLKEFEGKVRGITSKIDDARASLKAQVDEADARFREARRELLAEEYRGCAGPIADVIPFSAVLEDSWLNRSTAEARAVSALCDKAAAAVRGYEAIAAQDIPHKDEVVMRYAQTLDLAGALAHGQELAERDRKMAEFKAAQEAAAAVKAERRPEQPAGGRPEPEPVFRWSLQMTFDGTRAHAQDVASALKSAGVTGASLKCEGMIARG